ncbi:ribonuclease H-like domain-containing protein [Tanacetum coccineum]
MPKDNSVRTNKVLSEDWVSDDEDIFQSKDSQTTVKPSFKKIEFTKARNEPIKSDKQAVKPRMGNGVTAVKASGTKPYLADYQDIDGGFVAFGEVTRGGAPSISFMRPFRCPVTILNTLDPLGKFDGKAEEGFLVGYFVHSKAFRVFNSETRKVEENLHVNFLENKPNVAGQGPNWLFDIVLLDHQVDHHLFLLVDLFLLMLLIYLMILLMPELEDTTEIRSTGIFGNVYDDHDLETLNTPYVDQSVGAEADFNNMEPSTVVSPIPITRVHFIHPKAQIIRDLKSDKTANLSNATVYAFLTNQPNESQLVHEDLEQIHEDDLEEIDLEWQLALLSMRARRYYQRTGKKINIKGSDTVGYEKSKVECFNCHKMEHFVRECRDSEENNDKTCSNTCLKSFEALKTQLDNLRVEFNKSEFNLATYKRGLASLEEHLIFYKKNELICIPTIDLSNSGLNEFQQPEFEGYGFKANKGVCENSSNEIKKTPDALIIEDWVSDCDEDDSKVMVLKSDNVHNKPEQANQPKNVS